MPGNGIGNDWTFVVNRNGMAEVDNNPNANQESGVEKLRKEVGVSRKDVKEILSLEKAKGHQIEREDLSFEGRRVFRVSSNQAKQNRLTKLCMNLRKIMDKPEGDEKQEEIKTTLGQISNLVGAGDVEGVAGASYFNKLHELVQKASLMLVGDGLSVELAAEDAQAFDVAKSGIGDCNRTVEEIQECIRKLENGVNSPVKFQSPLPREVYNVLKPLVKMARIEQIEGEKRALECVRKYSEIRTRIDDLFTNRVRHLGVNQDQYEKQRQDSIKQISDDLRGSRVYAESLDVLSASDKTPVEIRVALNNIEGGQYISLNGEQRNKLSQQLCQLMAGEMVQKEKISKDWQPVVALVVDKAIKSGVDPKRLWHALMRGANASGEKHNYKLAMMATVASLDPNAEFEKQERDIAAGKMKEEDRKSYQTILGEAFRYVDWLFQKSYPDLSHDALFVKNALFPGHEKEVALQHEAMLTHRKIFRNIKSTYYGGSWAWKQFTSRFQKKVFEHYDSQSDRSFFLTPKLVDKLRNDPKVNMPIDELNYHIAHLAILQFKMVKTGLLPVPKDEENPVAGVGQANAQANAPAEPNQEVDGFQDVGFNEYYKQNRYASINNQQWSAHVAGAEFVQPDEEEIAQARAAEPRQAPNVVQGANQPEQNVNQEENQPGANVVQGANQPEQNVNQGENQPGVNVVQRANQPEQNVNQEENQPGANVVQGANQPEQNVNQGENQPGANVVQGANQPEQNVNQGENQPGANVVQGANQPEQNVAQGEDQQVADGVAEPVDEDPYGLGGFRDWASKLRLPPSVVLNAEQEAKLREDAEQLGINSFNLDKVQFAEQSYLRGFSGTVDENKVLHELGKDNALRKDGDNLEKHSPETMGRKALNYRIADLTGLYAADDRVDAEQGGLAIAEKKIANAMIAENSQLVQELIEHNAGFGEFVRKQGEYEQALGEARELEGRLAENANNAVEENIENPIVGDQQNVAGGQQQGEAPVQDNRAVQPQPEGGVQVAQNAARQVEVDTLSRLNDVTQQLRELDPGVRDQRQMRKKLRADRSTFSFKGISRLWLRKKRVAVAKDLRTYLELRNKWKNLNVPGRDRDVDRDVDRNTLQLALAEARDKLIGVDPLKMVKDPSITEAPSDDIIDSVMIRRMKNIEYFEMEGDDGRTQNQRDTKELVGSKKRVSALRAEQKELAKLIRKTLTDDQKKRLNDTILSAVLTVLIENNRPIYPTSVRSKEVMDGVVEKLRSWGIPTKQFEGLIIDELRNISHSSDGRLRTAKLREVAEDKKMHFRSGQEGLQAYRQAHADLNDEQIDEALLPKDRINSDNVKSLMDYASQKGAGFVYSRSIGGGLDTSTFLEVNKKNSVFANSPLSAFTKVPNITWPISFMFKVMSEDSFAVRNTGKSYEVIIKGGKSVKAGLTFALFKQDNIKLSAGATVGVDGSRAKGIALNFAKKEDCQKFVEAMMSRTTPTEGELRQLYHQASQIRTVSESGIGGDITASLLELPTKFEKDPFTLDGPHMNLRPAISVSISGGVHTKKTKHSYSRGTIITKHKDYKVNLQGGIRAEYTGTQKIKGMVEWKAGEDKKVKESEAQNQEEGFANKYYRTNVVKEGLQGKAALNVLTGGISLNYSLDQKIVTDENGLSENCTYSRTFDFAGQYGTMKFGNKKFGKEFYQYLMGGAAGTVITPKALDQLKAKHPDIQARVDDFVQSVGPKDKLSVVYTISKSALTRARYLLAKAKALTPNTELIDPFTLKSNNDERDKIMMEYHKIMDDIDNYVPSKLTITRPKGTKSFKQLYGTFAGIGIDRNNALNVSQTVDGFEMEFPQLNEE